MIPRLLFLATLAVFSYAQCNYQLSVAAVTVATSGDSGFVNVFAPAGCAWFAQPDSAWLSTNPGSGAGNGNFTFTAAANDTPTRVARIAVGNATLTITQPGGGQNALPEVRLVSPASGTGLTQTFTFSFRDLDGSLDILRVQTLIHDSLTAAGCLVYYSPDTNEALLLNPAGGWLGPKKLGDAGTLQNSYCTLDTAASSATPPVSGNLFNLTLKCTFSAAYPGPKLTFGEILDRSFSSSGYQQLGTWTVPAGGTQPPSVLSLSPTSGSGVSQTFTARFSDPDGAGDIVSTRLLAGSNVSGAGGCLVDVRPVANQVYLASDDGSVLLGPAPIGVSASLENAQCAIDTANVSITSGAVLQVNIPVTFKAPLAGTQPLFVDATDTAGNTTGLRQLGNFNVLVGLNQPPQSLLATPGTGAGTTQLFRFQFRDPNGAADILRTQMRVAPGQSNASVCLIYFDRPSGNVALLNDAGTQFSPSIRAGTPGTIENSQCILDAGRSSSDFNGTDLFVSVYLTFKSSFTGQFTLSAEALDQGFLSSGYQVAGTWTVPSVGNLPPTVISVSPNSGSASSQTFRVTASDPNGALDIQRLQFNITSGSATCLMEYTRSTNSVSITLGPELPAFVSSVIGAAGQLIQTSTCSLNAPAVVVTTAGTTLTVDFPVSFKAIFAGFKDLRANVVDSLGLTPGERSLGSFTALQGGNEAPSLVSVTPSSGGGVQQVFAFKVSDPNGATDILRMQVIVYDSFAPTGCLLYYDRPSGNLLLMRDDGTAWLGPLRAGSTGTLQNSFCTLNGATSSAIASNNVLTLNADITFASSFTGVKQIWMETLDSGGLEAGYSQVGTFTVGGQVGNVAPQVVAPDSSFGTGQANTFTFRFTDANGATDIQRAQMRWSVGGANNNACLVYYNRISGQLSLLNDAGTTFSAAVAIKSANRLQNSQCIVDAASSRATVSGNSLTVDVSLRFTVGFENVTAKDIAAEALDAAGLSSGYQAQGQWLVQRAMAPNQVFAVNPEGGSGSVQTFHVTIANPNGSPDTVRAQILINRLLVPNGSCLVYYDAVRNSLALMNDAGTTFGNAIAVGASGTIQNTQCSLNVATAAASQTGAATLLDLPITFKTAFGGQRAFFVEMLSGLNGSSGYGLNGYWFVPF